MRAFGGGGGGGNQNGRKFESFEGCIVKIKTLEVELKVAPSFKGSKVLFFH
jgi:hypothetical protein